MSSISVPPSSSSVSRLRGGAARSGWATSPRKHITLEEIQEAYEESRAREAEAAGYGETSVPGSTGRDEEADMDVVPDAFDANLN